MGGISNFDIHNPILTFHTKPNIVFQHSKSHFDIRNKAEYRFLTSKSYFGIRTGAEYRILTYLTFEMRPNSVIDIQNPILTIKMRPNIVI